MKSYIKIIILHLFVLLVTPNFLIVNAMDIDKESDIFPLDVWEEMEDWNRNKDTVSINIIKNNSQPTEIKLDVLKEIESLDEAIPKNNNTITVNKVNPYWMPEELIAR